MGRGLLDRLAREGCRVNVALERETAETRVANSAGAAGSYRSTGIAVSAGVWRIAGDDVLGLGDAFDGADLPSDAAPHAVAAAINTRPDRPPARGATPLGARPR